MSGQNAGRRSGSAVGQSICQMERVAGIEPARPAWEAGRLPLHHTRPRLWLPPDGAGRNPGNPYRPYRKVFSWNHAKGERNMNAGHRVAFPGALQAADPPVPGCFAARDRPVRQWRPTGGASVLSGADQAVFGAPQDQAPPETRDGPEDMEHGISGGGCRVDPFPGADRVDLSGPEAVDGPMEFTGRAVRAVGADDGGGVVGPGPVERGRRTSPGRR